MTDAAVQPPELPTTATSSTPAPTTPAPPTETTIVNQTPAPAFVPLEVSALTMPEGLTIDDESMTSFLATLNNQDLSLAERAQALIDLQASLTTKSSEAGSQAWKDQLAGWEHDVANHPELGGANLPTTLANIGRVMDKFANEEVRAAFDQTGAGSHPAIVGFLNALGMQFAEAPLQPPGTPPGSGEQRSLASRLNLTGSNNPT